jgi:hypothetical protein
MKLKMKMVIFFASVLLTVLAFNMIASYVYVDMARAEKQTESEVITFSVAKAEKEPPQSIVPDNKQ